MSNCLLAVDPGLKGAIVCLDMDYDPPKILAKLVTPMNREGYVDTFYIKEIIDQFKPQYCFFEKNASMSKQGVKSMYTFGHVTGEVRGGIAASAVIIIDIKPKIWQKAILAGLSYVDTKDGAIKRCQTTWANVNLLATKRSRVSHTGISDALCIGLFGVEVLKGKIVLPSSKLAKNSRKKIK